MLISRKDLCEIVAPAIRRDATRRRRCLIFDLVHMGYIAFECGYGRPRPAAVETFETLFMYLLDTIMMRTKHKARVRLESGPRQIRADQQGVVVTSADLALLSDHYYRLSIPASRAVPAVVMHRWLEEAWNAGIVERDDTGSETVPTQEAMIIALVARLSLFARPNGITLPD